MDLPLTLLRKQKAQGRSTAQSSTQILISLSSDRISLTSWNEQEEESDEADSIVGPICKSQLVSRHTQAETCFKLQLYLAMNCLPSSYREV